MDWNKKKLIDRFVQSVAYHGPSLITLTKQQQGEGEDSPMNFLYPSTEGNMGTNYFRNKLQVGVSCPVGETGEFLQALDSKQQMSDSHKETLHSPHRQQTAEGPGDQDDDFDQRIRRFVASKADLLFSMEGKQKLQRGVDYGMHSNQEVLDLYADTPPLETLMEVPLHVRRMQLFKCLKKGDIVIGKVAYKRPFGIIATLTMLEFGCNRDFTDLDIQALCKLSELDSSEMSKEYKEPADSYVIGDVIRGVIIDVNVEETRVLISLRRSRLPQAYKHLHLGVIDDPDTVFMRLQSNPEGLNYEEHLSKHKGFNNPRNIKTLTELLGIDTSAPCSLLRSFQRWDCPEGDYAEPLRKQQSAKWSMDTTAKGVEHFKAGNYDAALKYFEHALQIDGGNVEALVARGALSANQDKLTAAIKDFRDALVICPSHRNANKYLAATLVEHGIQQEKEGLLTEAVRSFNEALGIDKNHQTAKDHLEKIQQQIKVMEAQRKKQTAARVDKGLKSRFSHVRELILEEQSQAKKKRKRTDRKKKKKVKSLKEKKKKKKTRSKARHRSKRSSSSSVSSSESSSESESSKSYSSDNSEEWVEKDTIVQGETKLGRDQGHHSKRDKRDESLEENRVHPGASLHDNRVHKDTIPHRGTSRTESSPDSDRNNSDTRISRSPGLHRMKSEKTARSRHLSSSQSVEREKEKHGEEGRSKVRNELVVRDAHLSPRKRKTSQGNAHMETETEGMLDSKRMNSSQRVERDKEKHREEVRSKGRNEHAVHDAHLSPRKRKTSERKTHETELEGILDCKGMKSPKMENSLSRSPLNETFLERELKRIRAHSDKGFEKHQTSALFLASNHGNHDYQGYRSNREGSGERQSKGHTSAAVSHVTNFKAAYRESGRSRQSSTSLGSRDQASGSVKDNKSYLVSYEDSSDENS